MFEANSKYADPEVDQDSIVSSLDGSQTSSSSSLKRHRDGDEGDEDDSPRKKLVSSRHHDLRVMYVDFL